MAGRRVYTNIIKFVIEGTIFAKYSTFIIEMMAKILAHRSVTPDFLSLHIKQKEFTQAGRPSTNDLRPTRSNNILQVSYVCGNSFW